MAMADIAATVDMVMIGTARRFEYQGVSRPASAATNHAGAASCERPKFSAHLFPDSAFSRMATSHPTAHAAPLAARPRALRWNATRRSAVHDWASFAPQAAGPGKDGGGNNGGDGGSGTGVITRTRAKTAKPSMYKVLLLNDDYTPMEFVVHVLERFFHKNQDEAHQIMLHVHRRGVGVCGVYPYEIAETKVTQVIDLARKHQHPLQCTLEKD
jgi:ATP-dependent Clp protease adaptor protein ClpS